MGTLIDDSNITPIDATNFKVEDYNGRITIQWKDDPTHVLENVDYYPRYILGQCDTCNNVDSILLRSIYPESYDSVLVGGLGLGLIPQYLHTQGKSVDVIEIDTELIDYVDFIDSSINVIHGDIFTYNSNSKYDLIVVDLWWEEDEITDQHKSDLLANWSDNLNPGGKIVLPVAGESLN